MFEYAITRGPGTLIDYGIAKANTFYDAELGRSRTCMYINNGSQVVFFPTKAREDGDETVINDSVDPFEVVHFRPAAPGCATGL